MLVDPKDFILTEAEYGLLQSILADRQKRRALVTILESALLETEIELADQDALANISKQIAETSYDA